MNSLGSGSQCDIGPAVNQDPAFCSATQRYCPADKLKQLSIGKVLLTYLYKIHPPINGSLDARNQ